MTSNGLSKPTLRARHKLIITSHIFRCLLLLVLLKKQCWLGKSKAFSASEVFIVLYYFESWRTWQTAANSNVRWLPQTEISRLRDMIYCDNTSHWSGKRVTFHLPGLDNSENIYVTHRATCWLISSCPHQNSGCPLLPSPLVGYW